MQSADDRYQLELTHPGASAFGSMSPALPGEAGKREVDLYIRTYTTLLQSSGAIAVSSLEPAHIQVAASLHAGAAEPAPDMNAFMYSTQRLPDCIVDVSHIILGQSAKAFARAGYSDMEHWQSASAPGRRRKWHYDRKETLAAYIASASDLDDLVPTIVAHQIEWNKFHRILVSDPVLTAAIEAAGDRPPDEREPKLEWIGERLLLTTTDWIRLQTVWGASLWQNLAKMAGNRKRYTLRMLGGSYLGYARSTRQWWSPTASMLAQRHLSDRPIYFISSNTHSIVNILSGTARRRKTDLTEFIRRTNHRELLPELEKLEAAETKSPWENLLYFAARPYFAQSGMERERLRRTEEEHAVGITTIEARGAVDVGIQIIELNRLDPINFDPRLCDPSKETLEPRASDAVVININYPLGLAAYHIMTQIGMWTDQLRGVYILGKAATLNGRIGDVMIANVVYDEHSGNTYWLDNCFSYGDLQPYLAYGSVLDNQKAVTVKGTYLQNQGYLDFYYRENFTVVEMEAGPYLNAIFEDVFLRRHPSSEAINLRLWTPETLDLGILHYASDTPYTRAQTLGARGLSFYGMDSTYTSTIAILRRVFTETGILRPR